jgi:hypothetical protein
MMRSVILSSIIHAAVIAGFFFFSPATPVLEGYPTIYRVGLVSLPAGGRGGGGAEAEGAAEAKASISKQEEKGVSVKEVQKTTRKRRKPKEKAPTKQASVTSKKKTEGRVTQGDKLGSQYGLGDGISAAMVDGAGFGSPYYLSLVFGNHIFQDIERRADHGRSAGENLRNRLVRPICHEVDCLQRPVSAFAYGVYGRISGNSLGV